MNMKNSVKQGVQEALIAYRAANGVSQEEIANKAGINVSYVNNIENGNTHIGNTLIKDAYYKKIADSIGYEIDRVFWKHEDTEQHLQLYTELLDAKASGRVRVLIGKTRIGKTYAVDRFVKKNPKHTYRITVSSLYRLKDIINELCAMLNVDSSGSYVTRLNRIAKSLNEKKNAGGYPDLIIDEAENLTLPVLKAFKALYDVIKGYCTITFIGTPQFIKKIERLKDKDEDGMPQFYCRVKAGIRYINDIEKRRDFAPFLALTEDEGLKELLLNLADNYGELNDYLEYALREADRMNKPLTEELFKSLFKL